MRTIPGKPDVPRPWRNPVKEPVVQFSDIASNLPTQSQVYPHEHKTEYYTDELALMSHSATKQAIQAALDMSGNPNWMFANMVRPTMVGVWLKMPP